MTDDKKQGDSTASLKNALGEKAKAAQAESDKNVESKESPTNPEPTPREGEDDPNLTQEEKDQIAAQNEQHNIQRQAEPHKSTDPVDPRDNHPKPAEPLQEGETRDPNPADPEAHEPPVDAPTEEAIEEQIRTQATPDRSHEFETRQGTVSYYCQQFARLNLGVYQFSENRLELAKEDQADFEKLLKSQPPQIRNAIQLIDVDAADRFARKIQRPAMRQGVDTTASTRTGTPNPAPGRA